MINQMHIMHARRARRHTSQTRQAAIHMFDGFFIRDTLVFQHVFDQVNPAPGAVQLIAERHIGRARGSAKPAMHTGPQDFIAALEIGGFQLLFRKFRPHGLPHQTGVQDAPWIKFLPQTLAQHGDALRLGMETRMAGPFHKCRMARDIAHLRAWIGALV